MPETDPYGRHEVLHTAHLLADAFERWIIEHGAVQAHPTIHAAAADLSERLHAFYQLCGAAFLAPDPTEP